MMDHRNYSSRSSLPTLSRLQDEDFSNHSYHNSISNNNNNYYDDDDDETDEILIFEEEGDEGDDYDKYDLVSPSESSLMEDNVNPMSETAYDFGMHSAERPQGYSMPELQQMVTFVRSSKNKKGATSPVGGKSENIDDDNTNNNNTNDNHGDFDRERKSLWWCIENGCEEAKPGVWAGCWYFTYLFGEEEGKQKWLEARNQRLVKESGGRARQVPTEDYRAMLQQKEKGKRAFFRGQYKSALDCYIKAEELMGGYVSGMYLIPFQREQMVTLLSNQAECYLRLKKYEDAIVQSSKALQIDRRHNKSLLRRARATVRHYPTITAAVAASATEDLQFLIESEGEGIEEAQVLLSEINELRRGV